jgi:hypothetical protein
MQNLTDLAKVGRIQGFFSSSANNTLLRVMMQTNI